MSHAYYKKCDKRNVWLIHVDSFPSDIIEALLRELCHATSEGLPVAYTDDFYELHACGHA